MSPMHWLRRPKLGMKMFLLSFLSTSCLIVLLGYGSQQYVYHQFTKQQTGYVAHLLERTDVLLNQFMKDLQGNLLALSKDERLLSPDKTEVTKLLENHRLYWNYDIKNLYVIAPDGQMTGTSGYLWEIKGAEHVKAILEHDVPGSAVTYWTEPYMSPVSDYTISYIVRMLGPKGEILGNLVADLDIQGVLAAYGDWTYTSRQDLLLLSAKNRPLTVNNPYVQYDVYKKQYDLAGLPEELMERTLVEPYKTKDTAGNPIYVTRMTNNKWGWQVMAVLKEEQMYASIRWIRTYALLIGLLGIVPCAIVSLWLSRTMTRPMKALARQMEKLSAGDFRSTVEQRYRDEFGILVSTFNKMVGRIKQLMDDLVTTEKAKKHYELKVLQAQMQPHFLYNTLNSISYLSRHGQSEEVDRMITSLSALLPLHMDKTEELVPLAQELQAVEHYVYLMSVRFPDQFVLEVDVEEATLPMLVPKFSIQPLVENSLYHGILPKLQPGSIVITSEVTAEGVRVRIADDGVGIPEAALTELLKPPAEPAATDVSRYTHLGVRSIHDRLGLYFGAPYGLRITSDEGVGTVVEMLLPFTLHGTDKEVLQEKRKERRTENDTGSERTRALG